METSLGDSVLASFPAGICVVDGEGRLLAGNPALERLLGWQLSEQLGQPLSRYLERGIADPAQLLSWLVTLSDTLAQRRTTYLNLPVDFRTGFDDHHTVSVVGTMAPWQDLDAERSGALVAFHDSALHKNLESTRPRFLSVISHELGSPVASISAAAERMTRYLEMGDSEEWRLLEIIRSEVERLQRLLTQFLSPGRAEAEARRLARQIVALGPLMRRVAHTFRIRNTDCQIAVQVPRDLPFVWGDADGIQQALSNLVDNATRFAPLGTRIILAAKAQEDDILVSVTDQGPGISEEDEERLFELPCRCSEDNPCIEGRGLGLPISRALIGTMGGELWYERRPARGTCFCLTLPRAEDLPDEEEAAT